MTGPDAATRDSASFTIGSVMAVRPEVRVVTNVVLLEANGKPASAGFPSCTTTGEALIHRLHPGHHFTFRGVQLPLPPLARFLEVLMPT
jgi:hypothetical protein